MDLLNNAYDTNKVKKPELERVEKEKHEYVLKGTYLRRRGLKLFSYNPMTSEVKEAIIRYSDTIYIINTIEGIVAIDYELEKCDIDSRYEYFEALNLGSAKNRIKKFKEGKIKELFNLRTDNGKGIDLYNW